MTGSSPPPASPAVCRLVFVCFWTWSNRKLPLFVSLLHPGLGVPGSFGVLEFWMKRNVLVLGHSSFPGSSFLSICMGNNDFLDVNVLVNFRASSDFSDVVTSVRNVIKIFKKNKTNISCQMPKFWKALFHSFVADQFRVLPSKPNSNKSILSEKHRDCSK